VRFKDFFSAARAVRAISQAGLYPSNCRILDPAEAYNTGAGGGLVAIMVLAFESADHDEQRQPVTTVFAVPALGLGGFYGF
jgi:alkyldihydroxyacetonephosphate synthase